MAPTDLILKTVLRNSTLGTFGEVAILNDTVRDGLNQTGAIGPDGGGDYDLSEPGGIRLCVNRTLTEVTPTIISDIPAKEVIIVILMLSLWIYSIVLTRKAWYRILKE